MKIWQKETPFTAEDSLTKELFTESTLFFDIETTGFSSAHTQVYLIGCAARKGNLSCTTQFFAETSAEEKRILSAFLNLASQYQSLISFNGLGFDLPYLKERCACHELTETLDQFTHLDLYRVLSKFKKILKLTNLKQKSLEAFLNLQRDDRYSGGDLINIYQEYLKQPSEESCSLLKLHNYEDLLGMTKLLPLLSYPRLFEGQFEVFSYEKNNYQTYSHEHAIELILTLTLNHPLPKRFSFGRDNIYLTGFQNQAKLKIPIYQGELKYFYPNYKDYYYLPQEDRAIHKSVAFYVDKDFRTRAKAATCYSKKTGCFLPQFEEIITPYFKLEYHDKLTWFEMTEDFTDSLEQQKKYALHLLRYLL